MPVQAPQWTEFLLCPICTQTFEESVRKPISLGCGHTVCKMCLNKLHRKACPFDQTPISTDIEQLPVNTALLQLVGGQVLRQQPLALLSSPEATQHYEEAQACVEELALYLKPLSSARDPHPSTPLYYGAIEEFSRPYRQHLSANEPTELLTGSGVALHWSVFPCSCRGEWHSSGVGVNGTAQSMLSRPMQRKLVTLVHCQLVEEEGRIRAMRAARSLGERTVTELILQHQNPQQLSSNLWAAVRARGCQFLGPAMQEEALKLVLLALEDGSALSRKVLVLFVVQRLEPRFPQASKTSIGHVVQLLYRASCFKVTKRDEDSSLMQLKEEFRTYEALRREHDSQIVQIAMEGGLRIAPDQWSSLLYGDQSHKSHMQSIIDKTPASFAQSVQELTIALQRTGDPANLNRLRPHLELLANIDPSPDAPPPTWEQLVKGLVAVKTVGHGLVDFIQNHSKKGADQQQVPYTPFTPLTCCACMCCTMFMQSGVESSALCCLDAPLQHSKYKTYMCRDMKQKGGCPRGASCTFAHSQEELEKYRKMNKRLAARRTLSQSLTQLNEIGGPCSPGLLAEDLGPLEGVPRKPPPLSNGSPLPQLIPRGADPIYDSAHKPATSLSAPGSPPDPLDPVPKSVIPLNPSVVPHHRLAGDHLPVPQQMSVVPRGPQGYPQQQAAMFHKEPRSLASASQYPTGNPYTYQPPRTYTYQPPYPDPNCSYAPERQYPSPHTYPRHAHAYGPPPPLQPFPPRDEPPLLAPSASGSPYHPQPSSRDRYPTEGYCPAPPHLGQMRQYVRLVSRSVFVRTALGLCSCRMGITGQFWDGYGRSQPSLDYLHRRRKEIMAQLEERKVISPPPFAPSPTLPRPFPAEYPQEQYMEESLKAFGKEPDYASQYSPWSCDTIGSYMVTKDVKPKDIMATGAMEMGVEGKGLREPPLDTPRRSAEVKDDDPIIPFGSLPTVSRFGAIARTSKTGYQTTIACSQSSSTKHIAMAAEYTYAQHGGWSGASYPQHQTAPPQGHFAERLPLLASDREQLKMELQQVNQQINQHSQIHSMEAAGGGLVLQRDSGARAPAKWPAGGVSSEQLSLELHHVEMEIDKRTRKITMVSGGGGVSWEITMENQVPHEIPYPLKVTENGQSNHDHVGPLDDLSLPLSENNCSSSASQESGVSSMLSLSSKTSSLSLSADGAPGSSDLQKNGAVHSCS
ncbi:hypothetical protein JZ751_025696 [Albula glossodonta]|uniref:RING-type E3 ubiquitin transferase n=1 Tax=Albula glossodonta TaxID=121402 RepID=A0A8T2NLE6_9TELE|nr:hypothetical protein JZ751_025696 [Albula glossodonta]